MTTLRLKKSQLALYRLLRAQVQAYEANTPPVTLLLPQEQLAAYNLYVALKENVRTLREEGTVRAQVYRRELARAAAEEAERVRLEAWKAANPGRSPSERCGAKFFSIDGVERTCTREASHAEVHVQRIVHEGSSYTAVETYIERTDP